MPLVGNVYDASPGAGQFVACFELNLQNLQWNTRVGTDNTWDIDISPTAFLVSDCGQIARWMEQYKWNADAPKRYTGNR